MYINKILHDLSCQNCTEVQLNGISTVDTNDDIENYTHQELVEVLSGFHDLKCEKCQEKGKWIVSKIFLAQTKEVK